MQQWNLFLMGLFIVSYIGFNESERVSRSMRYGSRMSLGPDPQCAVIGCMLLTNKNSRASAVLAGLGHYLQGDHPSSVSSHQYSTSGV